MEGVVITSSAKIQLFFMLLVLMMMGHIKSLFLKKFVGMSSISTIKLVSASLRTALLVEIIVLNAKVRQNAQFVKQLSLKIMGNVFVIKIITFS